MRDLLELYAPDRERLRDLHRTRAPGRDPLHPWDLYLHGVPRDPQLLAEALMAAHYFTVPSRFVLTPTRAEAFALMALAGFPVVPHARVGNAAFQDAVFDQVVVYTSAYGGHVGMDKLQLSREEALRDWPGALCSAFLAAGTGVSYRLLKVGAVVLTLRLNSETDWRSNVGAGQAQWHPDVTRADLGEHLETLLGPLWAVDFVADGTGTLWAVDFNTTPGVGSLDPVLALQAFGEDGFLGPLRDWFTRHPSVPGDDHSAATPGPEQPVPIGAQAHPAPAADVADLQTPVPAVPARKSRSKTLTFTPRTRVTPGVVRFSASGTPEPHRASVTLTGWCRPAAEPRDVRDVLIGGVPVRDPGGRLQAHLGTRVVVRAWLRSDRPGKTRLRLHTVRPARQQETNDLQFEALGVLLQTNTGDRVVNLEVCPQGKTEPFTLKLHATSAALNSVHPAQFMVRATGGLVAGQLVVDRLEAVHAPVPEHWRTWRATRLARRLQARTEQARIRTEQARVKAGQTLEQAVSSSLPPSPDARPQSLRRNTMIGTVIGAVTGAALLGLALLRPRTRRPRTETP